jgi:hypothetical protein
LPPDIEVAFAFFAPRKVLVPYKARHDSASDTLDTALDAKLYIPIEVLLDKPLEDVPIEVPFDA